MPKAYPDSCYGFLASLQKLSNFLAHMFGLHFSLVLQQFDARDCQVQTCFASKNHTIQIRLVLAQIRVLKITPISTITSLTKYQFQKHKPNFLKWRLKLQFWEKAKIRCEVDQTNYKTKSLKKSEQH